VNFIGAIAAQGHTKKMPTHDSSLHCVSDPAASLPLSLPGAQQTPHSVGDIASWIGSARGGSKLALGQLLEVCEQYLMAIGNHELQRELHAKVAASDLVQETFLKAHCDFQTFQGSTEAELLAWLRKILLNSLFNHARRYRGTEKRNLSRELSLTTDQPGDGVSANLVADVKSPSRYAIANEEARWLELAMQRLPEDQQEAIRLRTQLGFSFADVGQRMNRSAEAARKLWSRGIERLQEELENCRDD
jgi:RNA polymerase sigma-70 factor (ECF subfamily)